MKDAVATMGDVLPDDVSGRDAVHVAVVSARATERLAPGQDVGMTGTGEDAGPSKKAIGIVDPFLRRAVMQGERFWLYLYPRTITSLRHHWTHPAFDDAAPEASYSTPTSKLASEKWLKDFTASADCPGYHAVMAAAERIADGDVVGWDGDYMHFDGSDAHGEIPPEFWDHVEVVIGRPINGKKARYFSCAC